MGLLVKTPSKHHRWYFPPSLCRCSPWWHFPSTHWKEPWSTEIAGAVLSRQLGLGKVYECFLDQGSFQIIYFATPIIVIAVLMNLWFVVAQGHGRERCVWHDVGFTCCFAIFSFHFKPRDVLYSGIIWDFIAKLRRFAFRFVCWEKRSWKSSFVSRKSVTSEA